MKKFTMAVVLVFFLFTETLFAKAPGEIWDLKKLYQPPKATWGKAREKTVKDASGKDRVVLTQKVWYENEPYRGKPTTVMAFYSRPKEQGTWPGLVLVHGGGGTAFSEWTEFWAARGYAAISMDHYGCEVDGEESGSAHRNRHRLANGGPVGSAPNLTKLDYKETWPYHAIAAIIRAHSLLDSLEGVDPNRTGVTGLSWGGYLTALVAGIDDRFQTAVPVYGCGNLDQGSTFTPDYKALGEKGRQLWKEYFDPVSFLDRVCCDTSYTKVASKIDQKSTDSQKPIAAQPAPLNSRNFKMLFVVGTDDFAFPLDVHRDTWKKVKNADVWIEVHMPHSQPTSERPEFVTWFDFVLKGGQPLPCLGPLTVTEENGLITASAAIKYGAKPIKARLWYSIAPGGYAIDKNGKWGRWRNRHWSKVEAKIVDGKVIGSLPIRLTQRPVVFYLDATDAQGKVASSHFERK